MNRSIEVIQIVEAVISSKIHTMTLFDTVTVESVQRILMDGTTKFLGKPPKFERSGSILKRYVQHICDQLNKLPNFLHSHIHFDPQPMTTRKGPLFGEGAHSTFNEIMTVNVNTNMSSSNWKDAYNNKFDREIMRLRSVVRHELAHRLDLKRVNQDPLKRIRSRGYRKMMTPKGGAHSYYGMPAEIVAHANHTVELMNLGHERGWKETLASYALTDNSRNFGNTKRFVKTVAKLMIEYDVGWRQRMKFRRELMNLAKQMRTSVQNLGVDEIDKALETALASDNSEITKSTRFISQFGGK